MSSVHCEVGYRPRDHFADFPSVCALVDISSFNRFVDGTSFREQLPFLRRVSLGVSQSALSFFLDEFVPNVLGCALHQCFSDFDLDLLAILDGNVGMFALFPLFVELVDVSTGLRTGNVSCK